MRAIIRGVSYRGTTQARSTKSEYRRSRRHKHNDYATRLFAMALPYLGTKISLSRGSAVIASICNHRSLNQSGMKGGYCPTEASDANARFICRSRIAGRTDESFLKINSSESLRVGLKLSDWLVRYYFVYVNIREKGGQ